MRWTDEQKAIATDMIKRGCATKVVAQKVGKSPSAVCSFASRTGLLLAYPRHHPWTPEEDADLRRKVAKGETNKKISADLGRTFFSVQSRRALLGIRSTPQTALPEEKPTKRRGKDPFAGVTFTDEKVGKMATVFAVPVSVPLTVNKLGEF